MQRLPGRIPKNHKTDIELLKLAPQRSKWPRWLARGRKRKKRPELVHSQDQLVDNLQNQDGNLPHKSSQLFQDAEEDTATAPLDDSIQGISISPFSSLVQDFALAAAESKDAQEIDTALSMVLGRLIRLGAKCDDADLILELYDNALRFETPNLRDQLLGRISDALFPLAKSQECFAWALKAVEMINLIQNPKEIPEKVLEEAMRFFERSEGLSSEKEMVAFSSSLGEVCVRIGRTDIFLATVASLLKISGPRPFLKAMQQALDQSFELWWISRDPRLINNMLYLTEILASRPISDKKLINRRNTHLESVASKLIKVTGEISDIDLLKKALMVSRWISEENRRKIVVSRIIMQLSLLGFAEQNSTFLDQAKSIIEPSAPLPRMDVDDLSIQEFVSELDSALTKWERISRQRNSP